MRIAFVHPRFPSAEGTGATHSATQIVTGLVDAGHDVRVYCCRSPGENPETAGLELRDLAGNSHHPHTNTRLNKEITARLDELREFDIVHSYLTPLISSVAQVGKDSDVGTVVTLNAYGGTCAKNDLLYLDQKQCQTKSTLKCLNCITRTGFRQNDNGYLYETASQLFSLRLINAGERQLAHVDGFQALSTHVKEVYDDFGYKSDKIEVIPNILDTRFDVKHNTNFKEPFKLLYVGSLQKSKGVDRLVDVLSRISKQESKAVSLTIVGDGPLKKSLEQEIIKKGFTDVVEVRGQVPYSELPMIYANHDVFLYPGRWNEPFGRIFLEAMAAGTPVVATNVGSVDDILGDAGIVTKQGIDSLTNGVLSVLDRQTLRDHSTAGKRRIERYRSSEVVPQFEQLYRRGSN